MNIPVQLGWIQSAINYVFDKVLNPLFSWASELLSEAFKWIFNTILGPLLETTFSLIMQTVGKYLMRVIGRILYAIEKGFLLILDMIQQIFDVLAGVRPVSDSETGASGSLLSVLVRSPFVVRTMLIVIAISIVLCFLFALVATIKSIGDMGGSQSRPVGQVIRRLAQAMLRMITAPLMGLFLVVLGDVLLVAITNAMTMDRNVTIAQSLFVISTLDAVDDEFGAVDKYGVEHEGGQRLELSFSNQYVSASTAIGDWDNPILAYNYSTRPTYLSKHPGEGTDYGLRDLYREPFYTGQRDYASSQDVDATFNVGRIDYFIGIGGSILFIFILGTAMFNFVSRLFDVIVLLIIEPFFIAPMPMDDGEHFQKWEEMFLGRLFSGYGMVVAMYVYLLVCNIVFDGRLAFTARSDMGDIMMDMMMRMLILIGGASTVMTAGPLVTSILSSVAGDHEAATTSAGMMFTGAVMDIASKPARALMSYGIDKAVGSAVDGITDKILGGGGSDQKFDGKKEDGGLFGGIGGGTSNPPGSVTNPGSGSGTLPPINPGGGTAPKNPVSTAQLLGDGAGGKGPGAGGEDEFDTVFDVGGKSLFDQDDGAQDDGQAFRGSAGGNDLFKSDDELLEGMIDGSISDDNGGNGQQEAVDAMNEMLGENPDPLGAALGNQNQEDPFRGILDDGKK